MTLVPPQLVLAVLAYTARDHAVGAGVTLVATIFFGVLSWSVVGPDPDQFGCLLIPFIWVGVLLTVLCSRIRRVR